MTGFVIVGAGEAGVRAAFSLRENGYGGPIDIFGAEIHLPYERPPLSKFPFDEDSSLHRPIRKREMFERQNIGLHLARSVLAVRRDDGIVELSDGSNVAYSKLLLATGAIPRRVAIPGAALCIYLRTLDDAHALRHEMKPGLSIAIVGAGFIGLEIAASARQRGCDVTVFEGLSRILSRAVPLEIASLVHQRHVEAGVNILCNVSLVGVTSSGARKRLLLADGREFDADIVVAGIGSIPDIGLAEACGLNVHNGIVVDEMLQTSDPDVFAAGDCCSFPLAIYSGRHARLESWRAAQEQGDLAARNMLGACEPFAAVPWFWSDQYELTLQVAGLPALGTRTIHRRGVPGCFLFHVDEDNHLVAVSCAAEGNSLAKDVRLSERLIAGRIVVDPELLGSVDLKLKALVATSEAT